MCKRFLLDTSRFQFQFFAQCFFKYTPKSAVLSKLLQTKMYDINYCLKKIEEFQSELEELHSKFDVFWARTEAEDSKWPSKKKATDCG